MNNVLSAIFFSLLLLISCLLTWYGFTKGHNWGGDFSAYIMQAQSVWQGKVTAFLQMNRFTIEESTYRIGPIAYPWGFPVLLAIFYAFFGLNILAFKSINIGFYIIFLILLWSGFRRYHACFWRLILVCLFAFNPYFLQFMNHVLSDIPFLAFSTFSILLIGRVIIQRRTFVSNITDQLLLGVFIAISYFIRTQGILILTALGITQIIKVVSNNIVKQRGSTRKITKAKDSLLTQLFSRSSNLWIFILPHFSFLIATLLWRSVLPEGGLSHISFFDELSLGLIKEHLMYYFSLPEKFFSDLQSASILYGATIPLAIIGISKRMDSDYHIISYGIITLFVLIVWPHTQGLRFLFPLLPFYVSFALTGLEKCHHVKNGEWKVLSKIICILPVIVVLIFFFRSSMINSYKNILSQRKESNGPYLATSKEVFSFISKNTKTNSIIVFRKPRVMRLFADRQSILIDQVDKLTRGDYLCISLLHTSHQIRKKDVVSLCENGKIRMIYENKDFELYQLKN